MDARINILFVMTGKPHIFGGGKRVFMQLMSGLSKDTFTVSSCCSLSKEQEEDLRKEGVRIINTPLDEYNPIVSILQLSKIMRSEHIHIVHSQGSRADFYCRVAARMARVSFVVNTIAVLVDRYDVKLFKKIFYVLCDRITKRLVDKFIVVSDILRNILIMKHGIDPDKVVRIYNGIELDRYKPIIEADRKLRKEFLGGGGEFIVGSVGRLVHEKGYEFLLKAMPRILEVFPNTKFVIVGDGPLRLKLESLARDLRILQDRMFVGFRDDIPEVLSSFDVFVLPSIMEGHPIAILESMAMAKPIIATDINGVREQIKNGRTGILVPPGDPQALSEGINQLLKDTFQAQQFGIEARKQVEEIFDIRRQVALHEEVYKDLVKEVRNEE